MRTSSKVITLSSAVAGAAALVFFGVSPVQAAPVGTKGAAACEAVVAKHYPVGDATRAACANVEPEPAEYGERLRCQADLEAIGVETPIAQEACWAKP